MSISFWLCTGSPSSPSIMLIWGLFTVLTLWLLDDWFLLLAGICCMFLKDRRDELCCIFIGVALLGSFKVLI